MDKESSLVEGSIDRIIKFKEQRQKVGKNKHKEEGKGRIKSDMKDRKNRTTLQNCICSLKVELSNILQ